MSEQNIIELNVEDFGINPGSGVQVWRGNGFDIRFEGGGCVNGCRVAPTPEDEGRINGPLFGNFFRTVEAAIEWVAAQGN